MIEEKKYDMSPYETENRQKLAWEDIDWLWAEYKLSILDIQKVEGYEDFQICE